MSTVVITLTDSEDGATVDAKAEFGDKGVQDSSSAHHLAIAMLGHAAKVAAGEVTE